MSFASAASPMNSAASGIAIFVYHLDDGSIVAIGATGANTLLLYATMPLPQASPRTSFRPQRKLIARPLLPLVLRTLTSSCFGERLKRNENQGARRS